MLSPRKTALRRTIPRTVFAASLVACASTAAVPAAQARSNHPKLDTRERQVIHRINAVRAEHGLARLAFGRKLSNAADRHSKRLQRSRTLSHQLPGEASLTGRLASAARAKPIGEVVFFASRGTSSAAIVRAWMDSPGHRAVLLSTEFGRAGVGIRTGRGGLYATVDVSGR